MAPAVFTHHKKTAVFACDVLYVNIGIDVMDTEKCTNPMKCTFTFESTFCRIHTMYARNSYDVHKNCRIH